MYPIELDSLRPEDAARLRSLVKTADFFALPAKMMKPVAQSWDFIHSVTVEDEGKVHTVQFHADAAPPELANLAKEVEERSPSAGRPKP